MISLRAGIPMVAEITNESATPEYSQLGGYVSGYSVNFKFSSKTACQVMPTIEEPHQAPPIINQYGSKDN